MQQNNKLNDGPPANVSMAYPCRLLSADFEAVFLLECAIAMPSFFAIIVPAE